MDRKRWAPTGAVWTLPTSTWPDQIQCSCRRKGSLLITSNHFCLASDRSTLDPTRSIASCSAVYILHYILSTRMHCCSFLLPSTSW